MMMPKFERPTSLFGKIPYPNEQIKIVQIADMTGRGVAAIDPELMAEKGGELFYFPFIFTRIFVPEKIRVEKSRKLLGSAYQKLEEIGV